MNHPTPEEWMSYLYEEAPGKQRKALSLHLKECAHCRETADGWKFAQSEISRLKFTPPSLASSRAQQTIAWGLAAAFVLFAGVSIGRFAEARTTNPRQIARLVEAQVRAHLEAEIQSRVDARVTTVLERNNKETSRLVTQLADSFATMRENDKADWLDILNKFETDQNALLAAMRADLETVAVVGESRLRSTQQEIGKLATLSETAYQTASQN